MLDENKRVLVSSKKLIRYEVSREPHGNTWVNPSTIPMLDGPYSQTLGLQMTRIAATNTTMATDPWTDIRTPTYAVPL